MPLTCFFLTIRLQRKIKINNEPPENGGILEAFDMNNLSITEDTAVPLDTAKRRYVVLLRYAYRHTWELVFESRHGVSYDDDDAVDIVDYNKRYNGKSYDSYAIVPILEN